MKFWATTRSIFWVQLILISSSSAAAWVGGGRGGQFPHSTSRKIQQQQQQQKQHCGTSSSSSSSSSSSCLNVLKEELPDYGKTSVEIDKIELADTNNNNNKNNEWRRHDLFGSSIVDETLSSLKDDKEFQDTQSKLQSIGLEGITKEERTIRRRALKGLGVPSFSKFLGQKLLVSSDDNNINKEKEEDSTTNNNNSNKPYVLSRQQPKILQINIGLYCNQACGHCHVESSPLRTEEMMTAETAARCLEILKNTPSITALDITGGAPELNENFRYLVKMARSLRPDIDIIDRCNLTVLQEPNQEDLIDFLKSNRVHIIASLPCYSEENVDKQRGRGVFERSIAALLALNDAGYGRVDGINNIKNNQQQQLKLDLVYNPLGAFLPPPQDKLELQYKEQLENNFGILFNQLFTFTNMPIKRFADFLYRRGELADYMDLLVRNFNPDTVPKLMCMDTISVGWDGKIYDCDFNQQLGMPVGVNSHHKGGKTVFDIESLTDLMETRIRTDNHCFGCTAGMGSS